MQTKLGKTLVISSFTPRFLFYNICANVLSISTDILKIYKLTTYKNKLKIIIYTTTFLKKRHPQVIYKILIQDTYKYIYIYTYTYIYIHTYIHIYIYIYVYIYIYKILKYNIKYNKRLFILTMITHHGNSMPQLHMVFQYCPS